MRARSADRSRRLQTVSGASSFGMAAPSPKSDTSTNSDMLDLKLSRKQAESELQQLANRVALLKMEEQKAAEKVSETKSRAAEIQA